MAHPYSPHRFNYRNHLSSIMFGVDTFNYGQTFHAPITDYTDPDDEKYYCITYGGNDVGEISDFWWMLLDGKILYIKQLFKKKFY